MNFLETLDSLVNYKLFCFGLNKDESLVGVGEEGAGDWPWSAKEGTVKSRRSCSLALP